MRIARLVHTPEVFSRFQAYFLVTCKEFKKEAKSLNLALVPDFVGSYNGGCLEKSNISADEKVPPEKQRTDFQE